VPGERAEESVCNVDLKIYGVILAGLNQPLLELQFEFSLNGQQLFTGKKPASSKQGKGVRAAETKVTLQQARARWVPAKEGFALWIDC
jgi:hypothetical protein